jgi:hypothetical protein
MNEIVRRLISKVVEKFAGSGVEIDASGRLSLPDGLDAARAHRFIELCLDETLESPKAALDALFARVGVARSARSALDQVIGDRGELDLNAVARNPLKLSGAVPRLLEIPGQIQSFLVDGLGLADPGCASLQEAVVSTRRRAAERIGCDASWDAILDRTAEVAEISRAWREGTGAGRPG